MPILSDTQQPLSADHPIWIAWRSWLHSEEGEVHRKLARAPMFIDSSLLCAFLAGYKAANPKAMLTADEILESERKRRLMSCPETCPDLVELLRTAAAHKMAPDEVREQRISFVWGNLPEENRLTKEEVAAILDRMDGAS